MSNESKFWNKIARKYAAKPVPDEHIYEQKLARTREIFNDDMSVLELGCGTGTTALHLAPFVKSIVATDYSDEMIRIANEKKAEQKIENVEFRCTSIEALESETARFDVVMAHNVLHLVKNKQAVIKQVHSLLKPGGAFVSNTACLTGWIALLRPIWPLMALTKRVPPVRFFSDNEVVNDHLNAGFTIEYKWQPTNMTLFLIARKSQ